jgi:hypothetical protein
MKNAIFALLYVVTVVIGIFLYVTKKPEIIETTTIKTDTLYVKNTVRDTLTQVKYQSIIRHDTLLVDNIIYKNDTTYIQLPIEHKHYNNTLVEQNDTIVYDAYISGYKAHLDSIAINYNKAHIVTTITHQKIKRWTYGVQAGAGYGLINGKPDVFVGIGVQYNLNFK